MASLAGALVGGVVTIQVAKTTLEEQALIGAYSRFIGEAARVTRLVDAGSHTENDVSQLTDSYGVILRHGSDEAICWSTMFAAKVPDPGVQRDIVEEFNNLLWYMRGESGRFNEDWSPEECIDDDF